MSIKHSIRSTNSALIQFMSVDRAQVFTAGTITFMILCVLFGLTSGISSAAKQYYSISDKSDIPVLSGSIVNKQTPDTPDTPDKPESPDLPETKDTPKPEASEQTKKKQTETKVKPPEKHVIKIGHIVQYDKLITGCELISANVVLNYYKKNVDYEQIIKHTNFGKIHVSKDGKWYGPSPYEAFLGDPHRIDGMGCFAPVIADMVDDFGFTDLSASDTTGTSLKDLSEKYIANDIPVMIWVSDSMGPIGKGDVWHLTNEDGSISKETFTWPLNEHCVVLMGYDKNNYYLSDPLSYSECVMYDKKLVEARFKDLGCMSVVIEKTGIDSGSDKTGKTTDSDSKSGNTSKKTDSDSKSGNTSSKSDSDSKSGNTSKKSDSDSKSGNISKKTDSDSKSGNTSKKSNSDSKSGNTSSKSNSDTKSGNTSSKSDSDSKSGNTSSKSDSDSKSGNTSKKSDSNSKPGNTSKKSNSDSKSGNTSSKSNSDTKSGNTSRNTDSDTKSGKTTSGNNSSL